ncbi:MAG TPA: hypothetical protein VKE74_06560 [Gemmataceae bacterium]|nr:hypothetical protein [Gemmataceae bacterium]
MQPLSPLILAREGEPNFELLRRSGWSVNTISGPYCVAWKGRDEVVFQWRDGAWQRVGGSGGGDGV